MKLEILLPRDIIPVDMETRREFLVRLPQRATAIAVSASTLGVVAACEPNQRPDGVSKDTLTEPQLKQANISINNTFETKLFLRKGVFEIPVFRDAKEGRIKGVIISLVDNDVLSWNAISRVEGDARFIWEMLHPSPKTWPEEAWQNMRKRLEANPETPKEDLEIIQGPRDKAIEYYLENGLPGDTRPMGTFYRTEPLVRDLQYYGRLNLLGKMFIYVCVGKSNKPDPSDSYPTPSWFEVSAADKGKYPVQMKGRDDPSAGFIIRHESFHYKSDGGRYGEYETDLLAFDSITKAWKKFKETGDSSGYIFVFVNDRGITITKKPEDIKSA